MNIDPIMRLPDVEAATGKKKSAIYKDPTFPQPVKLGPRASGWLTSEVAAWIESRRAERDAIAA